MKSDELLTAEQVRDQLSQAAGDLRQSAADDQKALQTTNDDYAQDLKDSAYADIVQQEPATPNFLPVGNYEGVDGSLLAVGDSAFEVAFNDAKRRALGAVAGGVDQYMPVVINEAMSAIDDLLSITTELGVEAAQLAIAAASGVLIPPTTDDVESYQDQLGDAKDQATVAHNELVNLKARRTASAVAAGATPAPDSFPLVSSSASRPLVRTLASSESADRSDQGITLAQGAPGQNQASVASDQASKLRDLMRAPALDRINYIAICGVIGMLARNKDSRDRAQRAVDKIKRIFDSIGSILSGHFAQDIQANLEAQAEQSVQGALSFIQSKLDAADAFLKTVAGLPGPFVATVEAIGDVPDTTPVVNSIASLCALKGAKFCDLNGLLEIAKSLDNDLGLNIPVPPMIGRVLLTLDAPDESQAPHHVTVPGQEADLILVSSSVTVVVARFSRSQAPVSWDNSARAMKERANVFGDGGGTITILGNGSAQDQVISYSAVTFDPLTNNYSFAVSNGPPLTPTVRGESDTLTLAAGTWDDTTTFPVGNQSIAMRVPESQARDISLPCDLALGFGEQSAVTGEYDASVANQVRSLAPAFESWMVGLPIDLGDASENAQATTRTIATFIDTQTVTYSDANVPSTRPGSRGTFRVTLDKYEVCRATAMVDGPIAGLKTFTLASPLTKPHARMLAVPQTALRIVPAVRNDNLDPVATPADPGVRDQPILPIGSTVVLATYQDVNQEPVFSPLLIAAQSGAMYIDGHGPLAYDHVATADAHQLRFTLTSGTTTAFASGVTVEVQTMSMLDNFSTSFPSDWFKPIDTWLLGLSAELNRLESKLCRLLSGSNQDIAASATALGILAGVLTVQLTGAKILLGSWLLSMSISSSMQGSLDALDSLGASRASSALREGRIADVANMSAHEGIDAGAALIAAQSYQQRLTTEEQYRILALVVAELRGRVDSIQIAAEVVGNIQDAQTADIDRRLQAAQRLDALQKDVP